jgi:hypothetical protein
MKVLTLQAAPKKGTSLLVGDTGTSLFAGADIQSSFKIPSREAVLLGKL